MIVWLNGTFGAGKTVTAHHVVARLPDARIFDPETVGYLLGPVLASVPVRDFQDWKPWRSLVAAAAGEILDYVGGTLVVPQSVLVEQYWDEIESGLREAGFRVHHVVLHADPATLRRRIEQDATDPEARPWRLEHLPDYQQALGWLSRRAQVIDTTGQTPEQVAELVSSIVIPTTAAGVATGGGPLP